MLSKFPSKKFSKMLNFSSAFSVLKQFIPYASFLQLFQLMLRKFSCLESNKQSVMTALYDLDIQKPLYAKQETTGNVRTT
jgi:hypothetical protein